MRPYFLALCLVLTACTSHTTATAEDLKLPELEPPAALAEEPPLPLPGEFDGARYKPSPAVGAAYKMQLSPFVAYYTRTRDIASGLGIGFGEARGRLRTAVQIGERRIGAGFTYLLFPVIDFGVGASYTRDFEERVWTPGVHVSFSL